MRKTLFALLLSLAGTVHAQSLEIEVVGLKGGEGRVLVAIYDSAEAWMKKPLRGAVGQPDAEGKLRLRVDGLPEGDYALSLIHDANGNGKLDMNVLGMPTEPFGFSNNAMGSFGPPKFEQARFTLKGDTLQQIKLN